MSSESGVQKLNSRDTLLVGVTDMKQVIDTLDLPPEYLAAMYRIMRSLHYPVAPDGTVVDCTFIEAVAGYHLARCGMDLMREPLIKRREVKGPGIIEGACQWVDPSEPSDPIVYRSPLDDLENMSMAQIKKLPLPLRNLAFKRLGLQYDKPGWRLKPKVNIEDAPEPDDGVDWIRK